MSLLNEDQLVAYWIPRVGIGGFSQTPDLIEPSPQILHVLPIEALQYMRSDGSPHITILILTGANFTKRLVSEDFAPPYLTIDSKLQDILSDGRTINALHGVGMKVSLGINGTREGYYGWQSIPRDKINDFIHYLKSELLDNYHLDGIDIGDSHSIGLHDSKALIETVKYMKRVFPPETIISKPFFEDISFIAEIASDLTFGSIMIFADDFDALEKDYQLYRERGFQHSQLVIGVNVGNPELSRSFTSVTATKALTAWQPSDGRKAGMMIWTFSQDIQQFTACPQNQTSLLYPNENDHSYQRAIIEVMELERENRPKF